MAACLDCGRPAPVINTVIGFFGAQKMHSKWCRACIGAHVAGSGLTPQQAVEALDAAEQAEAQRLAAHQEKRR